MRLLLLFSLLPVLPVLLLLLMPIGSMNSQGRRLRLRYPSQTAAAVRSSA